MLEIYPNIKATPKQTDELEYAITATEKIINSSVFGDALRKSRLTETTGLSKKEILKKIRQEWAINFEFYHDQDSKALGGASERLRRIRINSYRWYSLRNKVAVITHEMMHLIGFDHKDRFQHQSIPYKAEEIVKGIIDRHGYKEGKKLRNLSPPFLRWLFNWVIWL